MEGSGSESVQIFTDPDPGNPKASGNGPLLFIVKIFVDFKIFLNFRMCRLAGSSVKEAKMLEKCRGLQALSSSSPSRSGLRLLDCLYSYLLVFFIVLRTDPCSLLELC